MKTPISQESIEAFRAMTPEQAIVIAWTVPGRNPRWHNRCKDQVRETMPLLADALDRLVDQIIRENE